MDASHAITSSPSKAPPTFLTIAGELRNQIYRLLLVGEATHYPYNKEPCRPQCPKHHVHDPAVAILAVNKQINAEATPILYRSASFSVMTGQNLMKFFNSSDHVCIYHSPTGDSIFPSRHFIRNLKITFIPEHDPAYLRDQKHVDLWRDPAFRAKTGGEKAQMFHDDDRDLCELVWHNVGTMVPRLRGLEVLTIDVEQCLCPMGCCRMTDHVTDSLDGLKTKKGVKLIIKGCFIPGEEKTMHKALKCELDTKPAKPSKDPVVDAQRLRSVFATLYSDSESEGENGGIEDEEDSDEDDEEDEGDEDGTPPTTSKGPPPPIPAKPANLRVLA